MRPLLVIASHGFLDTETFVAPFDFSMVSAVPCPHANYASDKLIRSIPVLRKEGCNIDMFRKELRSLAWKDARYGCSERRNMMHYIGEVYDLSLEDEDARRYLNSKFDPFSISSHCKGDVLVNKYFQAHREDVTSASIDNRILLFMEDGFVDILPTWTELYMSTCTPAQRVHMNYATSTSIRLDQVFTALTALGVVDLDIIDLSCNVVVPEEDLRLKRRIGRQVLNMWPGVKSKE